MRKTSIYIDDDRKGKLSRAAQITGRSQADLIRDGIDHVIALSLPRQSRLLARGVSLGADTQRRVDQALEDFGQ